MSRWIEQSEYEAIAKQIPMLFVDLVIRDHSGKALIVKRNNRPLQGEWYVPGGRVQKQETILAACMRIAREELGVALMGVRAVGFYEDIFIGEESPYDWPLHTVSIVHECKKLPGEVKLDSQSAEWKWSDDLPKRFDYTAFAK